MKFYKITITTELVEEADSEAKARQWALEFIQDNIDFLDVETREATKEEIKEVDG